MRATPNAPSILVAAMTTMFAGCGGSKHVPASTSAQKALEASLLAWKEGKPVGQIDGVKPVVQAEDNDWRAKKKLAAFEIVGEEPNQPPDAPRRFNVKLTLDGSPPLKTVYVVFGNDPVFVYRDKDYETHFSKM
jgi:hypothetical protein